MCVINDINIFGVKSYYLKKWFLMGCFNFKCYVIGKVIVIIYVLIYIINRCIIIYNNKIFLRYLDVLFIFRSLDLERKSLDKVLLD